MKIEAELKIIHDGLRDALRDKKLTYAEFVREVTRLTNNLKVLYVTIRRNRDN